jgi:transposase, IS5 family
VARHSSLFALDERYRKLSEVGDPPMRLNELIEFDIFRPALTEVLKRTDGSKGGRPPYGAVLMFKVLILQTLYTLSDDGTEYSNPRPLLLHALSRARIEAGAPAALSCGSAAPKSVLRDVHSCDFSRSRTDLECEE